MSQNVGLQRIMKVSQVLQEFNLRIPNYQRAYKWTQRNVTELLSDIEDTIRTGKSVYRVGTLILHCVDNSKNEFEIVDGQQRILTFLLIMLALDNRYKCSLLEDKDYQILLEYDCVSQQNLRYNYQFIKGYIDSIGNRSKKIEEAIKNTLEFVVVAVIHKNEAFQLFDSQNTRGKRLDPHDLLKAYHLREINDKYIMRHCTEQWENKKSVEIRDFFNWTLFPITKWMNREKAGTFTERNIDLFKGVNSSLGYRYCNRTVKAMPCYQLGELFEAGEHFFGMVNHYMQMLDDIKTEIKDNPELGSIRRVLEESKDYSIGFNHAKQLFFCALMAYYDRFGTLNNIRAIKKMCLWAFAIRLDVKHLGFDTINKYAVGESANNYTNKIAMFSEIKKSCSEQNIANLLINTNKGESRMFLRENLKNMFSTSEVHCD